MSRIQKFIMLAAICLCCGLAVAQNGDCYAVLPGCLDSSFGNGTGKLTTAVSPYITKAGVKDVGIQNLVTPSGTEQRIVALGDAYSARTQGKFQINNPIWIIARYNQAGNLDTSFGSDGTGTVKYTNNASAYRLAIQPDNKILVAGTAPNSKGINLFTVARYGVNGLPDTSFGTGGLAQIPVTASPCGTKNSGSSGAAYAIALQSSGKIVVAGQCGSTYLAVVRLNPNGTLDTTFCTAGQFVYGGAAWQTALSLALDSAQRIVVAGSVDSSDGSTRTNALLRLTANGSLDTSFGGSGVVVTKFLAYLGLNYAVVIDGNDRILTTGTSLSTSSVNSQRMVLARYNPDGSLDASFGSGSGFIVAAPSLDFGYGSAVGLQTDGKILVGGSERTWDGGPWDKASYFAAWRFNADGSPDITFGGTGEVVMTSFAADNLNYPYALAQQADGKFILGGLTYVNGAGQFALARYWQ